MFQRLLIVFKFLNSHDVKYVVIGGIAAILHGVPRATFDLDVLIEATPENAKRLLDAFLEAGLGTAALTTPQGLLSKEITIFDDRVRIDVQTSTPGLVFADAWARRQTVIREGQPMQIVSIEDLIASKRAAGRRIDLEDVAALEADAEHESE